MSKTHFIQPFSLKAYHTFGIDVQAAAWAGFSSANELVQALHDAEALRLPRPVLILGGGSNVLFTENYAGAVLHNRIMGIETMPHEQKEGYVYVRSGAGESWHGLVMYAVQHGYGGIENMALIPGSVGAAPIQNIGAYGAELKDVCHSVEAYDCQQNKLVTLAADECAFGYRDSVFKSSSKGRYIITAVTLRLSLHPAINTSYGAIGAELQAMGIAHPAIADVSQAVMRIRRSKLPDPAVLGNAGSFFKNPTISAAQYAGLKAQHTGMPGYTQPDGNVKVPAGWLIEQCGWKGYRKADAGVHALQALVLVNYEKASGAELLALSEAIIASVYEAYGIRLEREVNIL